MSEEKITRPAKPNPYPGARNISSVQAVFDKPPATKLFVKISSDNLFAAAVFSYVLVTADNIPVSSGNIVINGDDYTKWTGDNDTPYTFTANKIGVSLL
jgi:hypothetical protein